MNATILALLDTNCPDWANILFVAYSRKHTVIFNLVYDYPARRDGSIEWPTIFRFANARLNSRIPRAPRM